MAPYPTGRKLTMDKMHRRARAQFGRTAEAYIGSVVHAKGEELALMVELAAPLEGRQVLDIATGAGHTALAFARAGAEVIASDLTPEMLAVAESFISAQLPLPGQVSFREAGAEALPFADDRFDVVTCRIAAHHFADPVAFVQEVARVLRPGGLFLLVDNVAPQDPVLAEAMTRIDRERDPSHVEAYTVARGRLVRQSGPRPHLPDTAAEAHGFLGLGGTRADARFCGGGARALCA